MVERFLPPYRDEIESLLSRASEMSDLQRPDRRSFARKRDSLIGRHLAELACHARILDCR